MKTHAGYPDDGDRERHRRYSRFRSLGVHFTAFILLLACSDSGARAKDAAYASCDGFDPPTLPLSVSTATDYSSVVAVVPLFEQTRDFVRARSRHATRAAELDARWDHIESAFKQLVRTYDSLELLLRDLLEQSPEDAPTQSSRLSQALLRREQALALVLVACRSLRRAA